MNSLDLPNVFLWMQKLIALAVMFQTIEMLQLRSAFSESGIWAWSVLQREHGHWPQPLRAILQGVLGESGFLVVLWLRLLVAFVAILSSHAVVWLFLLTSTILIALRWRGTFNGGSDYMTILVLGAVCLGEIAGENHAYWRKVGIAYVGLQTVLSFFIAGVAKLRSPKWRSGVALTSFLRSRYYGVPSGIAGHRFFRQSSCGSRGLSWLVIGFECIFPCALINPKLCIVFIALGVSFQAGNAYLFGLNRFLWAWAAAYPALYWLSCYIYDT